MNYFRKSLNVMGTPIRIQFKEGDNPYEGKRNLLTPTQQRKRKRLLAHMKRTSVKNRGPSGPLFFFALNKPEQGENSDYYLRKMSATAVAQ